MSVILVLIPSLVIGVPVAIADGLARKVGLELINWKELELSNQKRLEELLHKRELNLMEKKELKILQMNRADSQVKNAAPEAVEKVAEDTQTDLDTVPPPLIVPTRIRNVEYLLMALKELGAKNVVQNGNTIYSDFINLSIGYNPNNDGYIDLQFRGAVSLEEAVEFGRILETEYGKLLQEAVYLQLKNKAETKGLQLEEEYVDENDTIVLTYNLD